MKISETGPSHGFIQRTGGNVNEQEPGILTAEKAEKILFLSFRFSQGDVGLKAGLFYWLHKQYPHWNIGDQEAKKKIYQETTQRIKKFMRFSQEDNSRMSATTQHAQIGISEIETSVEEALGYMEPILNGNKSHVGSFKETMTKEDIVTIITEKIRQRDQRFVERGRPHRETDAKPTHHTDSYRSNLCYYALGGHSTGSPEYDDLFREMKSYIDKQIEAGTGDKFLSIIRVYNEKHPNDLVYADRVSL